jgi:Flp pilus assembly protein TadG
MNPHSTPLRWDRWQFRIDCRIASIREKMRRGATAVEMAVALAPFLLMICAIIEYGRFVFIRNVVENAAREGCRLAVVSTDVFHQGNSPGTKGIQEKVRKSLFGQDLTDLQITVYPTGSDGAKISGDWTKSTYQQGVAVEITGNYRPIFAGLVLKNGVSLKAKSIMNSEGH